MNIFAKIYCRIFQTAFRMALPVLPYREPEIIRSCAEIGKVAKKEKISSVLIVTDKGIVNNGLVDPIVAALQTIMSFPLIPKYAVLDASFCPCCLFRISALFRLLCLWQW